MLTKIEGLVIGKKPFDTNHLLLTICLRNGKKVFVIFYGGRGGGKKNRPSVLELGYLLTIELVRPSKYSDLYKAKEWDVLWSHKEIRNQHMCFNLMCFFLEVIDQVSPEHDLWSPGDEPIKNEYEHFNVLSNALFYLEKAAVNKRVFVTFQACVFLGKLCNDLGIFPVLDQCAFSENILNEKSDVVLVFENGSFADAQYVSQHGMKITNTKDMKELWLILKEVRATQTKDIVFRKLSTDKTLKILFNYFCFQCGLDSDKFKTVKLVGAV